MMVSAQNHQPPSRKRWRFSLRSLLIVMTILGAVLASTFSPMLHELRQAAEVTRQLEELRQAGYGSSFERRPDSYGLWLASKFWPVRVNNLGQQISMLQVYRTSRDLAELPQIPTVNELRFGYVAVKCADPNFLLPKIRRVTYEQAYHLNPPLDPDIHLLTHFPNVEEVRIWHVPADTLVLQDLQSCQKLRRLELCLNSRWITGPNKRDEAPMNVEPLRGLNQLEELLIVKLPESVDWSFLAEMTSLQECEINPLGWHTVGGVNPRDTHRPIRTRDDTPLPHLTRLPQLRSLKLQTTPAFAADLALLAKHTSIEHLQLEHLPEGPAALAELRGAKALLSLHLQMSQFEDLRALRAELQQLTQLRELSCEFREFTLEHAILLASLKQLETLRITHIGEYSAGPAGRVVLSETPLVEFQASGGFVTPGPYAKDVQKLITLAHRNNQQRAQAQ